MEFVKGWSKIGLYSFFKKTSAFGTCVKADVNLFFNDP